ncbi:MAG: hypothetical protein CVU29_11310 [Betaproteobacteria bacterium HGW-Betaproteobacteria-22]|nr:MAG: hypothetical protein CVU29_11310 [Betaproteobacteria bacterium HGW-Betaproteobacteria-22]
MIYHDEVTVIDLRESYSIDESVAKMLGWMHGPVRLQTVTQDQYGPIPEHLPHLFSLLYPLETHLQLLLDRAKHEYDEALHENEIAKLYAEDNSAIDADSVLASALATVNEKYDQISHWNKLTEKALNYKFMIKEELDKNGLSELKIDQSITDESGSVHIKLKSLNDWAKQFGVTIIDASECLVNSTQKPQIQTVQEKEVALTNAPTRTRKIRQRHNELSSVLDSILEVMPNPTAGKVMAELRKLIIDPDSCITCSAEDGVQWENGKGITKTLTHKLLKGRIKEWQELPLA